MKRPRPIILRALITLACVIALAACASTPPAGDGTPDDGSLAPGIYETRSGEQIGEEELYDRLAEKRFVVVGERHDVEWHHRVQQRIWREIASRMPAALGMEMFQRPFQDALDAYIAGAIDEDEMLEQTEYRRRWGYEPAFYRPMWTFARDSELPLVALNAPQELSRIISKVGVEGLTDEERAELPELDLSDEEHRAYVKRAFEQHDMEMSEDAFERFYAAQVVWDETMADTAVRFLNEFPEFEAMVIVAGVAHADARFGIPPRIERREEAEVATVRPLDPEHEGVVDGAEDFAEEADFVWVGPDSADQQSPAP